MYMVEEHIQQMNQKVDKLQDDMMWAKDRIAYLENKVKTKVRFKKESPSVSGSVRNIT
jgi:hypothetical protein